MSAKNIKGIVIEIGGSTQGLDKALKDVNKQTYALQNELKQVEKGLKFRPDSVELLSQKQELLTQSIQATTQKLDQLKNAQSQVEAQFKSGDIGADQYRAFKREIEQTEGKLGGLKGQLSKLSGEQYEVIKTTDKLGQAFKEAGSKAKDFAVDAGNSMATVGAGGIAAVGGLVIGMQDYNQVLARLKANSLDAGRDIGVVEEAFQKITTVTGEADAAGETLANLLASGFNDEQLSTVIDQVNGAYIRFSDTLKTEGIADGIQETLAAGEAVGPFAELLERSGISLEDFNKKLADAQAKGEGTNLILQTLTEQGFGQLNEKYKELNPEVQANAEANANLQKSLADLALALSPIVTKVSEVIASLVAWATENPKLAETVTALSGVLAIIVGLFMTLSPVINVITALWPVLAAAIGAITAPVALVIAGITALIAIGVLLYKNWDEIKVKSVEIWGAISEWFSTTLESIKTVFSNAWESIKVFTSNTWNNIKTSLSTVWESIKTTAVTVWTNLVNGIKTIMNPITTFFDGLWKVVKNIFAGALLLIVDLVTGDFEALKKDSMAIWNNIKDGLKQMWEVIKGVFLSAVNAVKSSVSTAWENIKSTTSSLWNGIKDTISNIWTSIKTTSANAPELIKNTVRDKFESLKSAVGEKMTATWEKIKDIWSNVTSFFEGINLSSIGKDIIQGLINGISDKAQSLFRKAKEIADSIKKTLKNALDIHSPSRWMRDMIGSNVVLGIVDGIDAEKGGLFKSISDMSGNMQQLASPRGESTEETKVNARAAVKVISLFKGVNVGVAL